MEWFNDNAFRLGASLTFYTLFSMVPLFVIVITLAGGIFDEATAREEIKQQFDHLSGEQSAREIEMILQKIDEQEFNLTSFTSLFSILLLIFTATNVFAELQDALNIIWGVKPKAGYGVKYFIRVRLLSFAMIIVIGFLLLVSLIVSALISAASRELSAYAGLESIWQTVNFIVSLAIVTILFAMIFKVLPDVKIQWSHVWIGAFLTALLFSLGKLLIGLYLGHSSFGTAYGAASSLVVFLLWLYYSSLIFFMVRNSPGLCQEFCERIRPTNLAVRIDSLKKT